MPKLGDTIAGARMLGARMAQNQRDSNPDGRMPLLDHIRELRNRLLKALSAIVVGTVIGLIPIVYDHLWNWVYGPFSQAQKGGHDGRTVNLAVTGVFDPFMVRVQIALYFGLIVTSPFWLYQLGAFIAPGLYRREKRWTYAFVFTAAPLFVLGATLAYFVMSKGLRYLLALAPSGVIVIPTISNYLSYFQAMMLGFGLAFELPLALVMLNMVGIITHERIRKWRRYMIFGVFVFSGIASPSPDPITMLMLAIPCVLLIEVAELIIWSNDRRRAARPSMYEGLADDEISPLGFDTPPPDEADVGRPGSDD
jgi:sec-independent protein translocase protein TatC